MTDQLPENWTIDEEENGLPEGWTVDESEGDVLPPGWTVDEPKAAKKLMTAEDRDTEKLRKLAGPYMVEEKTPEELKKMSIWERMQYAQDLNTMREVIQSKLIVPNVLSGASFGLTENIPGLEVTEFEETNPYSIIGAGGNVVGSLVPLTGLMKVFGGPATKLASKSPVFQKQLSSLATMFGVGATDKALHQIAKGEMPSAEDVLEHGLEWAALDVLLQVAGYTGRFAKGLLEKYNYTGIPRKEILNDITRKLSESGVDMKNPEDVSNLAMKILKSPLTEAEMSAAKRAQFAEREATAVTDVEQEVLKQNPVTPKDLKTRKIEDSDINRLTSETRILSEPYLPEGIHFIKEAEALEKDVIQRKIDSVGTRAASGEELGTSIREDIESQLEAKKSEYRPLYEQAESAAKMEAHIPKNTGREAGNKLLSMGRLATKPEGYNAVIKTFENILQDSGYIIQRNEEGAIDLILSKKEVPVSDTIELARRLNEIIDYESVEPTVKDALRSVARAAKKDIREGLAGNADGLAAFELAEEAHAKTARKFGTESVRKARGQQAGEKISKMAESPTAMGQFKEVLSPEQYLQLEREMLEKINSQPYEKAKNSLREIKHHLSEENATIAKEIVESKNPHDPSTRKKLTQESILYDMSESITNGSRPEKTLNLWKTPKGQNMVKQAFHDSPNWPTVKSYLEKQSFNDMVSSVLKNDGKLDLKKYKSFMSDTASVNNIRAQGGEEAVAFFQDLDVQVKRLEENVKLLDKLPKKEDIERVKEGGSIKGQRILERMVEKDFPGQAKLKKWKDIFADTMGLTPKAAMSVFALMKLGIPNTVSTLVGYRIFNKLLTSPRLRNAFKQASKHQSKPLNFILSIERLGEAYEEEE